MSEFDKVIGYKTIKDEFLQICDMVNNRDIYEKLGAKLPKGVLLLGMPGIGKTLMAKCFIKESGLNAYTIRRNMGDDDFIKQITDTFTKAKENAPAIVFLDDMDKFANEDDYHRDAEEYVAVQAGIDDVKDSEVIVVATVNEMYKLPDSLTRQGRFDRKIEMGHPSGTEAIEIIEHYLGTKRISDDVNMDDLGKMMRYNSCADLETLVNESAISAAYARRDHITMDDMITSVLKKEYGISDNMSMTDEKLRRKIAVHEAGHAVTLEVLKPGSVGLISIRKRVMRGSTINGGFVHQCDDLPDKSDKVKVCLAGKVAVEMYYSGYDEGCDSDLENAINILRENVVNVGALGIGMVDVASRNIYPETSESMNSRNEAVVQAELERYLQETRKILMENRDFLERMIDEIMKKEVLLYSDVQRIRRKQGIPENVSTFEKEKN